MEFGRKKAQEFAQGFSANEFAPRCGSKGYGNHQNAVLPNARDLLILTNFAPLRLCARTLFTGWKEWVAQRRKDAKEDDENVAI
jgi:hypothetical protein